MDYYNQRIVTAIMYNERRKVVATFKDYLLLDDLSEYIKRYYKDYEA